MIYNNNDTTRSGTSFIYFAASLCLLVLVGCASPQIVFVKDDASFKEYKRVYLPSGDKDHDPRGLLPMVASKLRESGFDVKEVKHDDPIEGAQGTGFVISPHGHVLTAEHVLAREQKATIWLGGNRIEADVVCSDKDKDLALLKPAGVLPGPVEPLIMNFDTPARMGQDVYTIGFPLSGMLGRSPRLTKGLVSSTVGLKDNPDKLQVSVEIQAGNSGGPLLDTDGHVLGVLQATLNPVAVAQATGGTLPQNVNFAAKSRQVKSFLDACPNPVPLPGKGTRTYTFDTVKDSIVQVYSGLISTDFITSPKLVAIVRYQYFWDFFYRLRLFQIELYDYDSRQLLLKAGQYRDNPFATERGVIDKTMELIKQKIATQSGQAPKKQEEGAGK